MIVSLAAVVKIGMLFPPYLHSCSPLARVRLQTLLRDFPRDTTALDKLRQGIKEADYAGDTWSSWDDNWGRVMHPLFFDSNAALKL